MRTRRRTRKAPIAPAPTRADPTTRVRHAALLGLGAALLGTNAAVAALSPKLPPFAGD